MRLSHYLVFTTAVTACLSDLAGAVEQPFKIQVIDEETERGVPLVELETVNNVRYVTDSNGLVALNEPGLVGQKVFFHVRSHGYAKVFGSDSVVNTVYQGKIHWFWGDTNQPAYPLGNFDVPGAVSELPSEGGLDPDAGINLSYYVGDDDFARSVAKMPGGGQTIYFEGTYTNTFSGNPIKTPRYDYNQVMYKLDLSDPRLALPVARIRPRHVFSGQANTQSGKPIRKGVWPFGGESFSLRFWPRRRGSDPFSDRL